MFDLILITILKHQSQIRISESDLNRINTVKNLVKRFDLILRRFKKLLCLF